MSFKGYNPLPDPVPEPDACDFCQAERQASQLTVVAFTGFGTCGQACDACLRRPLIDFAYIPLQSQPYR